MLKKPEFTPQAQGSNQNPSNTSLEAEVIEDKRTNSLQTVDNKVELKTPQSETIYKTRQFKKYIKLCKEGKYISARITAKALGISPTTLTEWNKKKIIQDAILESVDSSVEGMRRAGKNDWKMYDRLIDRAIDASKDAVEPTINLTNLIQINTVSPTE